MERWARATGPREISRLSCYRRTGGWELEEYMMGGQNPMPTVRHMGR